MKGRPSKKDLILDAAVQVVDEQGAAHLTIDAVAATSKVSKGGVLYHFPNKKALLAGMLDRLIEHTQAAVEQSGSTIGGVHAHVLAFTQPKPKSEWRSSLAVLAAAAEHPELLTNARVYMRGLIEALRGGPNFADALVVLVAVEGQRLLQTLDLLPLEAVEVDLLNKRLLERAEEASQ